jgi:hypothetical protein
MCLETLANIASILTAITAVGASAYYYRNRRLRRTKLEAYLHSEKLKYPDKHTHTVLHLMAELGMTEEEVFRSVFDSSNIVRKIRPDYDTGLAKEILFEYIDKPKSN